MVSELSQKKEIVREEKRLKEGKLLVLPSFVFFDFGTKTLLASFPNSAFC